MISRALTLTYAGVGYLLAMASIAYFIGFLQDLIVPKGINDGTPGAVWPSLLINVSLLWAFGFQHSLTARTWFKKRWTRIVPHHLERTTYLYMTAAMTAALVLLWQPVPVVIWSVDNAVASWVIIALYLGVWGLMFGSTFPIGHFSFFGLAQAWRRVRNIDEPPARFTVRFLYAVIRHPISLGWMLTPLITPHMTLGQLSFAVGATTYVLVATIFEERDLVTELGVSYRRYRQSVPAFVPKLSRRKAARLVRQWSPARA